jgi:hemoglobin
MTQAEYGKEGQTFQAAGGIAGIQQLVEDFYAVMSNKESAAVVRHMHPDDLTASIDKLARFLCGLMDGPKRYSEKYGGIAIPPAHSHLPIGESEKQAWLGGMRDALDKQHYPDELKEYLIEQLTVPASRIVLLRQKVQQSQQQQ